MSKSVASVLILFLCLSFSFVSSGKVLAKDQDFTPEKLVAEHVKSIGNSKALSAIKSRSFVGTSSVEFIQGMSGLLNGQSMLVSQGPNLGIVMRFGDKDYPGEYFAYDGKEVTVGHMSPGQKSPLAEFLFRYNGLMKEGLLGGVMSSAWPLLNLEEKKAQLKYDEGKVNGVQLHVLEYRPKSGLGDMKIRMYFDWETFRHVRTDYSVRHREDASAQTEANYTREGFLLDTAVPESIYKLTETFDDFQKTGNIVLPQSYRIEYSVEGSGHAFIGRWDIKAGKWGFNATYDDKLFKAQK